VPIGDSLEQADSADTAIEIPVLGKLWEEDGCGTVAVFGHTFEEAIGNLRDGIICHLTNLDQVGRLAEMAEQLRQRAKERSLTVSEMGLNAPMVKLSAAIKDHRIFALV
jgi:predicted RNase H-like HicB family nuclease